MTTKQAVVPFISKRLMDNNRVSVYEVWLKPGEKTEMHKHSGDFVAYALTDCKIKTIRSSGKSEESEMKTGEAAYNEAQSHVTENIGKTEARILVFEFKK